MRKNKVKSLYVPAVFNEMQVAEFFSDEATYCGDSLVSFKMLHKLLCREATIG
jgi:hypothetical protein